jgi:hypothetical protein
MYNDLFSEEEGDDDSICLDEEIKEERPAIEKGGNVEVFYEEMVGETDKAYMFTIDSINMWFPKKMIGRVIKSRKSFVIPKWLYDQKLEEFEDLVLKCFHRDMTHFLEHTCAKIEDHEGTLVFKIGELTIPVEDYK